MKTQREGEFYLKKHGWESIQLTVDRTSRRQKSEENSSQLTTRVASVGYWSVELSPCGCLSLLFFNPIGYIIY